MANWRSSKYVTKTGRALPHGRTTRRSELVRTRSRGQERPLPLSLQCHPQKLTRTSRNPGCLPSDPVRAIWARLPDNRAHYLEGRGLFHPENINVARFKVVVEGKTVGLTADLVYGLAYVERAQHCGLIAELYL